MIPHGRSLPPAALLPTPPRRRPLASVVAGVVAGVVVSGVVSGVEVDSTPPLRVRTARRSAALVHAFGAQSEPSCGHL